MNTENTTFFEFLLAKVDFYDFFGFYYCKQLIVVSFSNSSPHSDGLIAKNDFLFSFLLLNLPRSSKHIGFCGR